jgi:HNH endonuclease
MICWFCTTPVPAPDVHVPRTMLQAHLDHIVPLGQGGLDVPTNWAIACSICNMGRRQMSVPAYCAWLDRVRLGTGWHPILHGERR